MSFIVDLFFKNAETPKTAKGSLTFEVDTIPNLGDLIQTPAGHYVIDQRIVDPKVGWVIGAAYTCQNEADLDCLCGLLRRAGWEVRNNRQFVVDEFSQVTDQ